MSEIYGRKQYQIYCAECGWENRWTDSVNESDDASIKHEQICPGPKLRLTHLKPWGQHVSLCGLKMSDFRFAIITDRNYITCEECLAV